MRIDTIGLRKALGFLSILLPIIVMVLCLIFGYGFPDSISATYYFDATITPFMIILGASSIVLMCYKGYEKCDDILCTAAGILGLLICLFPCDNPDLVLPTEHVGTFQLVANISGPIHNISAALFFILLAYNSYFLFTKTSGNMTENKKRRNIIFKACGIGMVASFILLIPVTIFDIHGGTWFVELIALGFFGLSWLTKANTYKVLFCD